MTYGMKRVVFWDPAEPTATRPLAVNVIGDQVYFPTVDLTKNVCELVDFSGNAFGNVRSCAGGIFKKGDGQCKKNS